MIPHSNEVSIKDLNSQHMKQGCLLKLQGSLHKYINIVGAVLISVWIIVVSIASEIVVFFLNYVGCIEC